MLYNASNIPLSTKAHAASRAAEEAAAKALGVGSRTGRFGESIPVDPYDVGEPTLYARQAEMWGGNPSKRLENHQGALQGHNRLFSVLKGLGHRIAAGAQKVAIIAHGRAIKSLLQQLGRTAMPLIESRSAAQLPTRESGTALVSEKKPISEPYIPTESEMNLPGGQQRASKRAADLSRMAELGTHTTEAWKRANVHSPWRLAAVVYANRAHRATREGNFTDAAIYHLMAKQAHQKLVLQHMKRGETFIASLHAAAAKQHGFAAYTGQKKKGLATNLDHLQLVTNTIAGWDIVYDPVETKRDNHMTNNALVDWEIVYNTDEQTSHAVSVLKGQRLHATDFAYTPNPKEPSTWKLRIDDARHVAGAIAALGKGFRGNKVEIPKADLPGVKRKVMEAWRKFHKGEHPPGHNVLNVREEEDDDDYDDEGDENLDDATGDYTKNQDDDEEGDDAPTENNKKAYHHSLKAMEESAKTEHHPDHTTTAHTATQIADRLGTAESNIRAAMDHDAAATKHDQLSDEYPEDSHHHKKAAHHHRRAKHSHEESMSDSTHNQGANEPTMNIKKLHRMTDQELDNHMKEVHAEHSKRAIDGFMGLSYQNPSEETPSAMAGEEYEMEDPEAIDWEQEFQGLGLSHNQIQNLLHDDPTPGRAMNNRDWWSQVPAEYQEVLTNAAQITNRERGMLLQQLTANMSEQDRHIAINKWKKLPLQELKWMVRSFVGNQAVRPQGPPSLDPIFLGGAGGAAFVGNVQGMNSMTGELPNDATLAPNNQTDWAAISKENRGKAV